MGKLISMGEGATQLMGEGLKERKRVSYDRQIDFTPSGFFSDENIEFTEIKKRSIPSATSFMSGKHLINIFSKDNYDKPLVEKIGGIKSKVRVNMTEQSLFEGYNLLKEDREYFTKHREYLSEYENKCDRCGKELLLHSDLDIVGSYGKVESQLCFRCDESLDNEIANNSNNENQLVLELLSGRK